MPHPEQCLAHSMSYKFLSTTILTYTKTSPFLSPGSSHHRTLKQPSRPALPSDPKLRSSIHWSFLCASHGVPRKPCCLSYLPLPLNWKLLKDNDFALMD